MTPLEDVLQQCTVKITVPGGWGTGFFVAPGLILTCAHVVRKAADSQVTVAYPAWQQPLSAIVKAKADDGKTLDLALVELSEPLTDHPCVLLDEEPVAIGQALYSYGYLESYANAAPVHPVNEGETGDTPPLLKLQGAQIEKGISGAALLNLNTGRICGMVKETRAAGFDLGGGAIPTRVILEQFPELRELQQQFHGGDPCGNGKAARRWLNLITQPGIDFQPYLNSIVTTYAKWQQYYTLTDAEGKQRQVEESAPPTFDFGFDFGLMVQTVLKEEREQPQQEKPAKERVERFSVLDGLRKYALAQKPESVLLVGRPGSGKSTALAKLLLEEAIAQKSEAFKTSNFSPSPRVPILVELRYWQGSLSDLIHNAITRHDPTLKAVPLDQLLTNALLLFDGVNELPSDEVRTELIAFRRNHSKVPMIFTTRDLSMGGALGIERKLEMLPLTEPQMQAFIRAYIPKQAEAMLRQLRDRLREFGQTPLLLWMLCEVFQQAPNNQLPSNLGGVFQAFTQTYETSSVRKHEVALLKGDVRPLSDRRLWKKALMAIAAIMMQGKTPIDFRVAIHRDEVERELSRVFPNEKFPVRDILDDLLKYHLLQNSSADQIEFRHQLIQEYYAAEYLLKLLPTLTDEHLKRDYLNYLKWTEPVALMLALVDEEDQAVRVVQQALDVDWRLSGRFAGEVKSEFYAQAIKFVEELEEPNWLKNRLLRARRLRDTTSDIYFPSNGEISNDIYFPSDGEISKCLETLGDSDSDYPCSWRCAAVDHLKGIRSERADPYLLKFLEHTNSEIRCAAASVFGEIGSASAVPSLLKLLEHPDFDVREKVAFVLGEIGSESVVPSLLKLLEDSGSESDLCWSSYGIPWTVTFALLKIGSEHAEPGLLKILENCTSHPIRLKRIAKLLGEIGSEQGVSFLLKLLEKSPPASTYEAVIEALGKIGSERAIPNLLKLFESSDGWVRSSVAEALGNIKSETAIGDLLKMLDDSESYVRSSAAEALGKIGSEYVVPSLIKLVDDSEWRVREEIAMALGKIGSEQAIPSLLKLLKDSEARVLKSAVYALDEIGSELAIPSLLKLLEDSDSDVRRNAADALGSIAKKHSAAIAPRLPHLLTLISTDSGEDAYSVIRAIQENCKYYNYEIFQSYLAAQKGDRPTHPNSDPNAITIQPLGSLTIMTDKAPIFNQQHATIGVNYAAEGSTIEFTQHTSSSAQTFEILLTDYQQFIEQLQKKYSTLADPTTVPQIIEVEAKLIEAQDQQRWQNFLNLKRLWNGSKKAGVKVGEHFAENNVWAKGAIAFLEGISEDEK